MATIRNCKMLVAVLFLQDLYVDDDDFIQMITDADAPLE